MKLNTSATLVMAKTHEGGPAKNINAYDQLRRSVCSCLLWEDGFYESGQSIGKRIEEMADKVSPDKLASLAIEARKVHNLRHVPLLLLTCLAKRGGPLVSQTIEKVISRADELSELLAIYWRNGKTPISNQMKIGLASAFKKFDEYSLAKYNRDGAVKLRDVLFLSHAKPDNEQQGALWKRLINNELATPETWEVMLSAGKDKKTSFENLLKEGKLGYLALLRNLRNMAESNVDMNLAKNAILARKGADRVLPFRFVAAARACPQMEAVLDQALSENISESPILEGTTVVLVDVSGSMSEKLSSKSDLTRLDAAAALASVIHAEKLRVWSFSDTLQEVPPRRGMAGVDAVIRSQPHSGTYLGRAIETINQNVPCDRLIVITDEQSADRVPSPKAKKAYMINVASNKNGVGYGKGWNHIDGFSEGVLRYIQAVED